MARKHAVAESPMDIDEDQRKHQVEFDAMKQAAKNTRWWKVLITVFLLAGIIAPIISVRAISNPWAIP